MRWNLNFLRNNKENEQATQELKILEDDIVIARDFFHQNRKNYFQNKKKLPIHLILGPSRFGKSTIVSQSGLSLIDVNNQSIGNISPTKYCSFWFTQDAIYIDTAGTYTKPDIAKPRNDLIWRGFIKLLQKYFGKNSIVSALIILDLPAITQDKNLLKKTLFCIRERIYETAALIKKLHTHIIFTKCDRILGFTDFFALLDSEERLQPFGIKFDNNKKFDIIPAFEAKFNKLLQHLNNRVIENIQKTDSLKKRLLIKMFPSQMDNIRQTFIEVLDKIPNSRNILLSGIYFTSSIQSGIPIDPIKTTSLPPLNLKEKPAYGLEANNVHSYFVEEIFKKAIHLSKQHKQLHLNQLQLRIEYFYALLVATLIIGASSLIGYQSYHKNRAVINQTKYSLRTQDINDHNTLYATINQLKQNSNSWWLKLGVNKTSTLYSSLTKTHQALFTRSLISQLETYLDNTANAPNSPNNQNLYYALQVYLMLGNPEKLDKNRVTTWFDNCWATTYENGEQKDLLREQLDLLLHHKFKAELNKQLIAKIRDNLNRLPPIKIMYLLLENSYADQNLEIDTIKPISKMYTNESFHKIYDNAIPAMVNDPPKYDWVLGDLKLQLATKLTNNAIKNLRECYLEQYIATWENSIRQGIKIKAKNLKEIAIYLNSLSADNNSPIITLLQQIKQQITIINPPLELNKDLNHRIQTLHNFDLTALQHQLNNITHYITTITEDPEPNKAAFDALIEYARNETSHHPITALKTFSNTQAPLLQMFLQSIDANIWQALLDAAYDHINQIWHQTVVPIYKETLVNKYPIFKDSTEDVKLTDFNNFFAPHGTIDIFFNQYINPLVKIDKTNWTWKNINGQKINFPQSSLEVFLRAALIQKMFYSTKELKPKVNFTLTPTAMTPHTLNFTLQIDGQKISFTHNEEKKSHHLNWPGPQPGLVTIDFVTEQEKTITTSEEGPWAWFRILDKANVTSTNNTKHFELTFDLNGNAAKYLLSTTEPVNPFIPEIISNFRCQDQLD